MLTSVSRLYPLRSVQDVGVPWWLFFLPETAGFFYLREQVFGGAPHSLYGLENEIVRARFADPRIHFALNCASAGCPRLPRTAFAPELLDQQLDRETRRFFAEPRNLSIDHAEGIVHLSQILSWYEEDFTAWLQDHGQDQPGLLEYAARYAEPDTSSALRGTARSYRIEFTPYDWRLNDRDLRR